MKNINDFKLQKEFISTVKFVTSSDIRMSILLSLYEGSKNINNFTSEIKKRPENILREIKKLIEHGFIEKKDKAYFLTSAGILIVSSTNDLFKKYEFIKSNYEFWNNHSLNAILPEFLENIDIWYNSDYVKTEYIYPFEIFDNILNLIKRSKNLSIVLSFFIQSHFKSLISYLKDGDCTIRLITTFEVIDLIKETGLYKDFKELINKNKFEIYLYKDELGLSLFKGDNFASLLLANKDNMIDYNCMLLSKDKKQINKIDYILDLYEQKSERYL